VQHQRLRVEAEIGPVGADHAQRIGACGQARQIAGLDGLQVMDMDVTAALAARSSGSPRRSRSRCKNHPASPAGSMFPSGFCRKSLR
jgi:hypothetical protein